MQKPTITASAIFFTQKYAVCSSIDKSRLSYSVGRHSLSMFLILSPHSYMYGFAKTPKPRFGSEPVVNCDIWELSSPKWCHHIWGTDCMRAYSKRYLADHSRSCSRMRRIEFIALKWAESHSTVRKYIVRKGNKFLVINLRYFTLHLFDSHWR